MKKILYDRLPNILLELYTEEEWNGFCEKVQRNILLTLDAKMIMDIKYVRKLILEMKVV